MADQSQGISHFQVAVAASGQRLDVYLSSLGLRTSRAKLQKLIAAGKVLVNAQVVPAKRLVAAGDLIAVTWEEPAPSPLTPVPMALDILFEDDEILVLNKPAGIAVHPGAGTTGPTLVQGLLDHCGGRLGRPQLRPGEAPVWLRPGIVHRLDKDTTGALVCAKTDRAHADLARQFHDKTQLLRVYQALLDGVMAPGETLWQSYLYRDPQRRLRFASLSDKAFTALKPTLPEAKLKAYRQATSAFQAATVYAQRLTLANVRLFTGRTHQIRVHALDLGLPVVGDPLYHRPLQLPLRLPEGLRKLLGGVTRQLLHAKTLGFCHPLSGERILVEAPLPSDFSIILKALADFAAPP